MKWITVSDLEWIEDLQRTLIDKHGYEAVQVDEGSLGIGDWIMIPTAENQYYFVIREIYRNEWTSWHQYMKCRKLPKDWEKKMYESMDA